MQAYLFYVVMNMMILCCQHALTLPFFIFLSKDIVQHAIAFSQSGMHFTVKVVLS